MIYQPLRFFFGLLLVSTGIGKLLDNRGFAGVIATYQLGIPSAWLLGLGLAFSLGELWLGLRVLRQQRQTINARLVAALHAGYLSLAVATILRGIKLQNCGCFGVFWARPLSWGTVIEDSVLLALSLVFCWQALRQRSRGSSASWR